MGTAQLQGIPEVNIHKWMMTLGLQHDSYVRIEPHGSPRGLPAVIFVKKTSGKDKAILSVWGETYHDGVNLYFVARPYEQGTPFIHMKFKVWSPTRGMAAILAIMAFHAERPRLPRKNKLADEWLRKMRDKILKQFYQQPGSFLERGIPPELVETETLAHARFNSLAGLDVQESIERVKKEFRLLTEHITEEDLTTMWRESIVTKVMSS